MISDAHLGVADRDSERKLLGFLRARREDAASIVINGDLFDFWFEWKHVIPRAGYRVLAAIAELTEAGIPVLWVAGNHDCWGGDVLRQDVGVDYHVGEWRGCVAGWRTRLAHGDGLRDEADRKYRALRSVLRHPLSVRAFRLLHPDLAARLALGSSHASRTYRAKDGGSGLQKVAMRDLEADPSLQLLVFGHSHVAALDRSTSGGIYANSGTWLGDTTFLRVDSDAIELRRWRVDGRSDLLGRERPRS
jgi:UDP-2,3-diacylglucosamine hydrolase